MALGWKDGLRPTRDEVQQGQGAGPDLGSQQPHEHCRPGAGSGEMSSAKEPGDAAQQWLNISPGVPRWTSRHLAWSLHPWTDLTHVDVAFGDMANWWPWLCCANCWTL